MISKFKCISTGYFSVYITWSRAPRGRVDWNTVSNWLLRYSRRSRPSRARGLKPDIFRARYVRYMVAPLAGAWIETYAVPLYRIVIYCRAPRGRVDWNFVWIYRSVRSWSRAPRGRVDWNSVWHLGQTWIALVAPLAGAWIETNTSPITLASL